MDTPTVDGYRIQPLSMTTWDAFADLAERHNGVWCGCCARGKGNRVMSKAVPAATS